LRATAWAVVDCADATEPKAILVENVPDFRRWRLYPQWVEALKALGYCVSETIVYATAHGVPQRRQRLMVAATKRRFQLEELLPDREPPFYPCIDWESGKWRPIASAREGARERMRAAKRRLGRFFLSQHVTNHPGVSLDEPIRTITTKDQWVVVRDDQYRPLLIRELARGMGFRDDYCWPSDVGRVETIRGLGNAIPPPMARDRVREIAVVA
jgi:DNA (cytosine-5)-methyltransferase 1